LGQLPSYDIFLKIEVVQLIGWFITKILKVVIASATAFLTLNLTSAVNGTGVGGVME
jgi:hypothetical protein